ncbi:GGDEF domain-containing protein [Tistrella bauzanensis]
MLLMVNLKVQRALADMADRDPLTGIGNRRMLDRLAGRHLPRSGTALVLIDLDGFKRVNDDHGHKQGDQALCWIADMLKASVRPGETVIRMGGDEFALFVEEAGDATALGQRVHRLAARINIALARDRHQMPLPRRISTGYAIAPDDGQTLTDLCAAADRRMYDDKHAARPAGAVAVRDR